MAQGSSNPTADIKKLGGVNISVGAGNSDAGTQRVVLATNQSSIPVTGTFWQATQPVSGTVAATQSGTWNIGSITTLPALATGSNTIGAVNIAAGQTLATVTNLAQLGGQAIAMGSGVRTTGTQRVTIATDDVVSISGTVTANIAANSSVNLNQVAGTSTSVNTGNADAGTQRVVLATNQPTVPVSGTFWQATQPVSGTITANQGGAWNIGTVTSITNSVAVTGPLTDTQLRASAVPVSLASVPTHPVTQSGTWTVGLSAGSNAIGSITNTSFAATQSGTWTVQPGNTANTTPWLIRNNESLGTATVLGALNANIVHALAGNLGAAAVITATSSPSGIVLTAQASYDGGTNYVTTTFYDVNTGLATATINTFAVGNSYAITAGDGATHVRVIATSWTSGSVTVRLSSSNAQGLVNLRSTAVHNTVPGDYTQLISGFASSTTPTAVTANNAARIWTTLNGAVNVADGNGSLTVDAPVATPVFVRISNGSSAVDTLPVSGTVTANTGLTQPLTDTQLRASAVPVSLASVPSHPVTNAGTFAVQVSSALPTGSNVIGAVTQSGTWNIGSITTLPTLANVTTVGTVTTLSQFGGQAINLNAGTAAAGTLRVVEATGATGTQTNPTVGTTSVTLLAANTNRRAATVFNGSSNILYLRLSATAASATTFTCKLQPDDYYEVPTQYNGAITGILNSGSSTLIQVTEIT